MTNRENIIKAINICLGHGVCNDCPYCLSGKGYTTMNCRDYMLRDVLTLLKEQEPVIPTKNDFEIPLTAYYGFECECTAPLMKNQLYCMKCGKPVKWNA